MPQVEIPPPYRGPTQGEPTVAVEADTVRGCLLAVGARYAGFDEQVFAADGQLHRFVKLFVNGEEIERTALDTSVAGSDRVTILAAIAGG